MGDRHIPIIDEDALDDLVTAVQALSAPSATNVSVDATGMDVITATNAQGALKQLDSAVDSLDSNLAQYGDEHFNMLSSSLTVRNNALHEIMGTVRSKMTNGQCNLCTIQFNSQLYCGFIWRATAQVIFGRLYAANSNSGFVFRDSSADSAATSTDFS